LRIRRLQALNKSPFSSKGDSSSWTAWSVNSRFSSSFFCLCPRSTMLISMDSRTASALVLEGS
jgi:hypothetical protein